MTIFEALRLSHEKQRTLMIDLTQTQGASEERELLFASTKKELKNHAISEERHFYKHLIDFDLTQEKGRHSVAEHKEIEDFIEELEETEMSSPAWLAIAKKLSERLTHHLDEEEHEVFQMAGKVLNEKQKSELAKLCLTEMKERGS